MVKGSYGFDVIRVLRPTNGGDHPVAANKLRFGYATDRRLGCIALFGLPRSARHRNGICFSRFRIRDDPVQIVIKPCCEFSLNSQNFVINCVHSQFPKSSSGEQISGGVHPKSRQICSISSLVSAFAMCVKFSVIRYCIPLVAAREM